MWKYLSQTHAVSLGKNKFQFFCVTCEVAVFIITVRDFLSWIPFHHSCSACAFLYSQLVYYFGALCKQRKRLRVLLSIWNCLQSVGRADGNFFFFFSKASEDDRSEWWQFKISGDEFCSNNLRVCCGVLGVFQAVTLNVVVIIAKQKWLFLSLTTEHQL